MLSLRWFNFTEFVRTEGVETQDFLCSKNARLSEIMSSKKNRLSRMVVLCEGSKPSIQRARADAFLGVHTSQTQSIAVHR